MDFNKMWVSFVLVGLAVFALISFVVNLSTDHGQDTILENEVFNNTYEALQTDLGEIGGTAQTQRENFEADPPTVEFGALVVFAIVSAGQIFAGTIISLYNIFIVLPSTFLGIPQIVVSVLSGIVIITIILSLWRLYKVGE